MKEEQEGVQKAGEVEKNNKEEEECLWDSGFKVP